MNKILKKLLTTIFTILVLFNIGCSTSNNSGAAKISGTYVSANGKILIDLLNEEEYSGAYELYIQTGTVRRGFYVDDSIIYQDTGIPRGVIISADKIAFVIYDSRDGKILGNYRGLIPDGETFEATLVTEITGSGSKFYFKKDGTVEYDLIGFGDNTDKGTYERDGSFIKATYNNRFGEGLTTVYFFVVEGKAYSCEYYTKK